MKSTFIFYIFFTVCGVNFAFGNMADYQGYASLFKETSVTAQPSIDRATVEDAATMMLESLSANTADWFPYNIFYETPSDLIPVQPKLTVESKGIPAAVSPACSVDEGDYFPYSK